MVLRCVCVVRCCAVLCGAVMCCVVFLTFSMGFVWQQVTTATAVRTVSGEAALIFISIYLSIYLFVVVAHGIVGHLV